METFFARYKNPLVLALLLAAQFVLLAVQVRPRLRGLTAADQAGVATLRRGVSTVVTPPEEVAHSGGLGVRGLWDTYINLVNLKQKNEQLEAENQRLQMEQAALSEDARQGQRLEELLAFRQHYVDTTVPAQIIGTSGSDHGRVVYIDKGSNDGIEPDMPVITPNGIVGRIRDVTPSTAQVLEIGDPTSAAGVVLAETRTRGIVRGNVVGQPEIVNLMPDARIQPGELVITSGGDQVFPRGLPVGTVAKVVPDEDNAPLVDVVLKPAANLGRLEEVLVVTGTSARMSAQARRDLARSQRTASGLKEAAAAKASEAEQAANDAGRASDILAMRLPSAGDVVDPDAPDAAAGSSPASANEAGAPLHPPLALHPDHYSPGDTPAATDLSPGQRAAPYLQGRIPTVHTDRNGESDALQQPAPGVSPAFLAAHNAAMAAAGRPTTHFKAAASPAQGPVAGQIAAHATAVKPKQAVGGKAADFGIVGEPLHRTAAAAGAARPPAATGTHPSTASALKPPTAAAAGTHPAATPAHRQPVATEVVTDGPLPARSSAAPPQAKPARSKQPTLVPDDGSRPPASTSQEPH